MKNENEKLAGGSSAELWSLAKPNTALHEHCFVAKSWTAALQDAVASSQVPSLNYNKKLK